MINVYADIFSDTPSERHEHGNTTVRQWLVDNVPSYRDGEQPISVCVNGALIDSGEWSSCSISSGDQVDIRPQPKGGVSAAGSIGGIGRFVTGAFSSAFSTYANTQLPGKILNALIDIDIPSPGGRGDGQIPPADARANVARLGDVIPELFGEYIRYPDYLSQPRRYYVDQRTQAIDILLSVGKGAYVKNESTLRIGNTAFDSLGSAVDYEFFEPGDDVTGHQAHENWYPAPEVGASTGSAGLRLKSGDILTLSPNAGLYDFDGSDIEIPYGAGDIPTDWEVGYKLLVAQHQSITVINNGTDGSGDYLADTLEGDFRSFTAGDLVTVIGDAAIAGSYEVDTFTAGTPDEITLLNLDGTPAAFLPAGTYQADIDYTGVRYEITAILTETVGGVERRNGVTVNRLNPDGSDDSGWSGFTTETTGDATVQLDDAEIAGDWAGPFRATPEGETAQIIEYDFFAPGGLYRADDDGEGTDGVRVTVEVQWREIGTATWSSETREVLAETKDQLGWTYQIDFGSSVAAEVRMRRVNPEPGGADVSARMDWTGLRAKLPAASSYDGITVLAMTLTGSDVIAAQSENRVNLVPTRKLPILAGATLGSEAATRNPAEAAIYIAKSIGYTDDELDLDEFQRLRDVWDSRDDNFDFVINSSTVRDAINLALRPGFAEMVVDSGIITPVRDEQRTVFEQAYSPHNMTEPLKRSFSARRPDESDGVEVEYTDGTKWTKETVQALLPGDAGVKLDTIRLDGVTDRDRAWRIGMRRRRAQFYRRWVYEFGTEMDAFNSSYLSYVPLVDDLPGYGQSAIMTAVEPGKITVSEDLDWSGSSHVVGYRDENGDLVGPFTATRGAADNEVLATLPAGLPTINGTQEPPHVFFGEPERWHFPALITEISPSGPLDVSVTATNYDDRVYDDDDNNAPS